MKEEKIKLIDLAIFNNEELEELLNIIKDEIERRGLIFESYEDSTNGNYTVRIILDNGKDFFNWVYMYNLKEPNYKRKTLLKIAEDMNNFPNPLLRKNKKPKGLIS